MDKAAKIQVLRQCPLFSAFSISELEEMEKIAIYKKYEKQDLLFQQDVDCSGFFLLIDGLIKIYRISPEGKEQILFFVQPRNTFAEASLFLGGRYPANAETIEKSSVFFFPKNPFIALLKTDANVSLKLMAGLSQWLHRLVNLVDSLTLQDAEHRLATFLINLVYKNTKVNTVTPSVELPMAKNILASHLGITSETLSRTLRKFQDNQLIKVVGKIVTISNLAQLKKLYYIE